MQGSASEVQSLYWQMCATGAQCFASTALLSQAKKLIETAKRPNESLLEGVGDSRY